MYIFQISLGMGIAIIIIAFLAEYMDSTLGMGYGTSLTPILILMGYQPMEIVPAVLLSELITGLLAGFTHHMVGNVDFRPKTMNIKKIVNSIRRERFINSVKSGLPLALRITIVIASCSIIGTVVAIIFAINLPKFYLKLYIGLLIFIIGIVIIATANRDFSFSWKRVTILGLIASFNKGTSGGGYGPVVTGGQLVAGVDGKNAIGITSLAEGLTCIVGVISYFILKKDINWMLAPYLIIGAVISVPLSAFTVRKMNTKFLKYIIGVVVILLGLLTLWNTLYK